eukprot:gene22073-26500_t
MEAQMLFHEGGDEVIAMVVAGMAAQLQGLAGVAARRLEHVRIQLIGQEFVGQALVDQDAVRK